MSFVDIECFKEVKFKCRLGPPNDFNRIQNKYLFSFKTLSLLYHLVGKITLNPISLNFSFSFWFPNIFFFFFLTGQFLISCNFFGSRASYLDVMVDCMEGLNSLFLFVLSTVGLMLPKLQYTIFLISIGALHIAFLFNTFNTKYLLT